MLVIMKKDDKNKKLIIGFDMDGVILDNSKSKIKVAKKLSLTIKLIHTPSEILKTLMTELAWRKFQYTLYDNHRFAFGVPLMRGIKGILSELNKKKIPYFLISRRKIPSVAIQILKKRDLWPRYFNKKNSFFVTKPEDKNEEAAKLGITHYIDDELKVINALSKVPNKFLFDPFNVFEKADHYIKIKSWSEFKKHIF